ncbi:hypothetical protein CCH79_00003984 [Gambusia affinis]|uniref:SH3 domain-containing protein n=1 Tax=Gambusia affinis TaxID=33528 RepID=A0A315V4H1_GAMAF|nr:hypothetical protein CCH79_00003984 [Gambusia affinis]
MKAHILWWQHKPKSSPFRLVATSSLSHTQTTSSDRKWFLSHSTITSATNPCSYLQPESDPSHLTSTADSFVCLILVSSESLPPPPRLPPPPPPPPVMFPLRNALTSKLLSQPVVTYAFCLEAVVEFDYEAQQDDELTLTVGDIIKNIRRDDGGWWEGELGGRRGFFPDNFVRCPLFESRLTGRGKTCGKRRPGPGIEPATTVSRTEGLQMDFSGSQQQDGAFQVNFSLNKVQILLTAVVPVHQPALQASGESEASIAAEQLHLMVLNENSELAKNQKLQRERKSEAVSNAATPDRTVMRLQLAPISGSKLRRAADECVFLLDLHMNTQVREQAQNLCYCTTRKKKKKKANLPRVDAVTELKKDGKRDGGQAGMIKSELSNGRASPVSDTSVRPGKKGEQIRKRRCKASFSYAPQHEDELELKVGDVIEIIAEKGVALVFFTGFHVVSLSGSWCSATTGEEGNRFFNEFGSADSAVEEGWWEGVLNGKIGMFPSNFTKEILADSDAPSLETPNSQEEIRHSRTSKDSPGCESDGGDSRSESGSEIQPKKIQGIGFGNIFRDQPIKLRPRSVDLDSEKTSCRDLTSKAEVRALQCILRAKERESGGEIIRLFSLLYMLTCSAAASALMQQRSDLNRTRTNGLPVVPVEQIVCLKDVCAPFPLSVLFYVFLLPNEATGRWRSGSIRLSLSVEQIWRILLAAAAKDEHDLQRIVYAAEEAIGCNLLSRCQVMPHSSHLHMRLIRVGMRKRRKEGEREEVLKGEAGQNRGVATLVPQTPPRDPLQLGNNGGFNALRQQVGRLVNEGKGVSVAAETMKTEPDSKAKGENECADAGWWMGEIGGRQGVFPDNFVKLLEVEKERPKKPPPPSAPSAKHATEKKSEAKKVPPERPEHLPQRDPDRGEEMKIGEIVKPSLPAHLPKKPLPPKSSASSSSHPPRRPERPPTLACESPKSEGGASTPDSAPDRSQATDLDLDAVVSSTEKLSHPTASRPRVTDRRPRSQIITPSSLSSTELEFPTVEDRKDRRKDESVPIKKVVPVIPSPLTPTPPTLEELRNQLRDLRASIEMLKHQHRQEMKQLANALDEEKKIRVSLQASLFGLLLSSLCHRYKDAPGAAAAWYCFKFPRVKETSASVAWSDQKTSVQFCVHFAAFTSCLRVRVYLVLLEGVDVWLVAEGCICPGPCSCKKRPCPCLDQKDGVIYLDSRTVITFQSWPAASHSGNLKPDRPARLRVTIKLREFMRLPTFWVSSSGRIQSAGKAGVLVRNNRCELMRRRCRRTTPDTLLCGQDRCSAGEPAEDGTGSQGRK